MRNPTDQERDKIREMWLARKRINDIAKALHVGPARIYSWNRQGKLGVLPERKRGNHGLLKKDPTPKMAKKAIDIWIQTGIKSIVAKSLGVSIELLQRWVRDGLIEFPDRGDAPRRKISVGTDEVMCKMGKGVDTGISPDICLRCVMYGIKACKYYLTSIEKQLYGMEPWEVWEKSWKELKTDLG